VKLLHTEYHSTSRFNYVRVKSVSSYSSSQRERERERERDGLSPVAQSGQWCSKLQIYGMATKWMEVNVNTFAANLIIARQKKTDDCVAKKKWEKKRNVQLKWSEMKSAYLKSQYTHIYVQYTYVHMYVYVGCIYICSFLFPLTTKVGQIIF